MKAIHIDWDVDHDDELQFLPTEIEIPAGMEDESEISDYISNVTGFCHKGFVLDTDADLILEIADLLCFNSETGAIKVCNSIFDDFVADAYIDICFIENPAKVLQYRMVSMDEHGINMECLDWR